MYCSHCLAISIEEIVAGKTYEHLTFVELESSSSNGCSLCSFFLQRILQALKEPIGTSQAVRIYLEQHSSVHRFTPERYVDSSNEENERIMKMNDEDDDFRDAMIEVASGYFSCLIALVARPVNSSDSVSEAGEKEPCYVTLEICSESGLSDDPDSNYNDLTHRTGDEPVWGDRIAGRFVRSDPCHPRVYSMISGWIQECFEHRDCGSNSDTPLPTRILEIGTKEDSILRLSISNGRLGRYVALSHCWGKRRTTTTTAQNFDQHLKSIDINALPANFKDSVIISRELGYKYLWIDSLCIIQGDADDWVKESSLMGLVYRNSALTLASSSSADSYGGLLTSRPSSCCLPNSNFYLVPKAKPIQTLEESELGCRAWASQERILAPRIAYYTSSQIFWECWDCRKAECTTQSLQDTYQGYNKRYHDSLLGMADMNSYSYSTTPIDHASLSEEEKQDMHYRPDGWFQAIQSYSRRHLTQPTDKLPALSGLAQNVYHPKRPTGGQYLAGIWSNDILRSLLWSNGEKQLNYLGFESLKTITRLGKWKGAYRAPSWSWVACDGPINHARMDDGVMEGELDAVYREQNADHGERCRKWNLKVLEVDIRLVTGDPFGQVGDGSKLVVEAYCQVIDVKPKEKTVLRDGFVECVCEFDVKENGTGEDSYLCLQVGRRSGNLLDAKFSKTPEEYASDRLDRRGVRCLLLKKVGDDEKGMWERVGVVTFDQDGERDSGWEKRVLTLI
jgi:hypothetical protein